jgi:hypothetical protein
VKFRDHKHMKLIWKWIHKNSHIFSFHHTCVLTLKVILYTAFKTTISIEHSPSRQSESCSADQKLSAFVNKMAHYHVHINTALNPTLSHKSPTHILTNIFSEDPF